MPLSKRDQSGKIFFRYFFLSNIFIFFSSEINATKPNDWSTITNNLFSSYLWLVSSFLGHTFFLFLSSAQYYFFLENTFFLSFVITICCSQFDEVNNFIVTFFFQTDLFMSYIYNCPKLLFEEKTLLKKSFTYIITGGFSWSITR